MESQSRIVQQRLKTSTAAGRTSSSVSKSRQTLSQQRCSSSRHNHHQLSHRRLVAWLLNRVYDASHRRQSKVILSSSSSSSSSLRTTDSESESEVTVQLYRRCSSTKQHTLKYDIDSKYHQAKGAIAIDDVTYNKFLCLSRKVQQKKQQQLSCCGSYNIKKSDSIMSSSTSSRTSMRSTWGSSCSGLCPADCDQACNSGSMQEGCHSTGRLSELIAIARRRGISTVTTDAVAETVVKHADAINDMSSSLYAEIHPNLISDRAKRNLLSRQDMRLRRVSTSRNSKLDLVRFRSP
jgi:hypothetical protein